MVGLAVEEVTFLCVGLCGIVWIGWGLGGALGRSVRDDMHVVSLVYMVRGDEGFRFEFSAHGFEGVSLQCDAASSL